MPVDYERLERAARNGAQPPLACCRRGDIPTAAYLCGDERIKRANQVLRRRFPNLEIIYDFTTGGSTLAPGFHVYKVLERGATPSGDLLFKVMSLQRDPTKPWPTGRPFKPQGENEVVDFVERHLIDPRKADEQTRAHNSSVLREGRRRFGDGLKDVFRYSEVGRGRNSLGRKIKNDRLRRFNRTPKVRVRV
ncbi:MAG: hypothetical protein V1929_09140 [bacterium]